MTPSAGRSQMWRVLAAAVIAMLAALSGAGAASAQVFYPSDRYDCTVYQAVTGAYTYVDSYQFQSGHKYSVGFRKLPSRTGLSRTFGRGTYKVKGSRIVSTSGYLTKNHEYLLIEKNGLAIVKNNGHFQGIGCYDATPHKLPPGGSSPFLGGASSVTYSCYETQYSGGTYSLYPGYAIPLTFYSDGTYQSNYSVRSVSGWHQNGNTIVFTAGPYWGQYAHDIGTWYPGGGQVMPHAPASVAGFSYSLVIKDTVAEGGIPPSVEFATSGPDSVIPMSFLYCKK